MGRSLRVAAGALVLVATLLLAAVSISFVVANKGEEHAARAGGIVMLVLVVPVGALWGWLLLSRPRGKDTVETDDHGLRAKDCRPDV